MDDVKPGNKFGIELAEGQAIGLKYYHDLGQRIPRPEAERIYECARKICVSTPFVYNLPFTEAATEGHELDPLIYIELMVSHNYMLSLRLVLRSGSGKLSSWSS